MIKGYIMRKMCNRIIADVNNHKVSNSRIKVLKDRPLFNNKCHLNTYCETRRANDNRFYAVFLIGKDGRSGILHFVNYDSSDKKFYDVTLGEYGKDFFDMYIVNKFSVVDLLTNDIDPSEIVESQKNTIRQKYLNWFERLFISCDDF